MMFYTVFTYSLNLPTGSTIEVTLPSNTSEFEAMSSNCEAYSAGFSGTASCAAVSSFVMQISGYGTYTQPNSISVYVRALSPPIATTTSAGSINVYYDSAASLNIGTASTLSFSVTGPAAVPTSTALVQFSKSS